VGASTMMREDPTYRDPSSSLTHALFLPVHPKEVAMTD
jgi:hypothetical protein